MKKVFAIAIVSAFIIGCGPKTETKTAPVADSTKAAVTTVDSVKTAVVDTTKAKDTTKVVVKDTTKAVKDTKKK